MSSPLTDADSATQMNAVLIATRGASLAARAASLVSQARAYLAADRPDSSTSMAQRVSDVTKCRDSALQVCDQWEPLARDYQRDLHVETALDEQMKLNLDTIRDMVAAVDELLVFTARIASDLRFDAAKDAVAPQEANGSNSVDAQVQLDKAGRAEDDASECQWRWNAMCPAV